MPTPIADLKLLRKEFVASDLPFQMARWAEKTQCGTAYCLGGFATTIAEFRGRGLNLEWSERGRCWLRLNNGDPDFDQMELIARFLGISTKQAERVFYYFTYGKFVREITKQDVIGRLDELIAELEAAEVQS